MSEFYSCTRRDPGIQNTVIINLETITFIECLTRDTYKVHFISGEQIIINSVAAQNIAKKVGLGAFRS